MYLNVRVAVMALVFAVAVPLFASSQAPAAHPNVAADPSVVECRVLEAHASAAPAALVVIFHQQQKQDQPRLAALIKENSGSEVELQSGSDTWSKVTVFRLRTCFGRGMIVLPPGTSALKDGDTFKVRFPKKAAKSGTS